MHVAGAWRFAVVHKGIYGACMHDVCMGDYRVDRVCGRQRYEAHTSTTVATTSGTARTAATTTTAGTATTTARPAAGTAAATTTWSR